MTSTSTPLLPSTTTPKRNDAVSSPKISSVHGACILANSIFGLGSIVGALGLPATNPLSFTFLREICAGSLLYLLSILTSTTTTASSPDGAATTTNGSSSNKLMSIDPVTWRLQDDVKRFWLLGFLLFLNQAGYIVGIGLAGPVTGSVWQPSAPIFTVAFSMLTGLEGWNLRRLTGVLIAFAGCSVMVLLSDHDSDDEDEDEEVNSSTAGMRNATSFMMGNIMFLMNCSATAGYILSSKKLLRRYPALTVTAWSYILASVFMFVAAFVSSRVSAVEEMICPSCGAAVSTSGSSTSPLDVGAFDFLSIPRAAIPALTYYIVFQSVTSWGLILWSNQYATGTLVVGYSVLQPVTSILFTTIFLMTHLVANCSDIVADDPTTPSTALCLNEPGVGTVCGMLGVACGLALVVQTEPSSTSPSPSPPRTATHHQGQNHRRHLKDFNPEHELQQQESDETLLVVSLTEYGSVPLLPKDCDDNDDSDWDGNYGSAADAATPDSRPLPCKE